jgi:hypothetical protein
MDADPRSYASPGRPVVVKIITRAPQAPVPVAVTITTPPPRAPVKAAVHVLTDAEIRARVLEELRRGIEAIGQRYDQFPAARKLIADLLGKISVV